MRKTFFLIALAISATAIVGCTNSKTNTSSSHATDTTQVTDRHTAETALDYFGEYKGTTPAADCPGIQQTLILNKDYTFTLNMIYMEREGADFNDSGTFTIEGNIVTLTAKNREKSFYKVEEGRIVMLMADKQPVTGDLAKHYVLKQEKVF